ncbi:MAG: tRNA uridine-5-carboxymethylaminomethyl(34) synthesis GTPase MnmE [Bacteroidales bacterium]|nr:tRNA uridine-5-carboxymethylaminomethyl(34) synthesis GTPase MnmE [Bacteroidales bacterium]
MFSDTICAPATSVGSGAITVIRVSGQDTFAIADKVVSLKKGSIAGASGYSLHFGTVRDNGDTLDDVLVAVFRAPHSYTGEDAVEISCHASAYIAQRILCLLTDAGARAATPGEFTRRAFVNGRMDLAQCEAVADLIASETAAAHRLAMNQLKGGYSEEIRKMRSKMLEITALMELELDFSEEDVEFADRSELKHLTDETLRMIDGLAATFRLGNAIKQGVPVAIAGAVNSGKSTLLNALLGEERAIVSDIAGTTRDTVEETMTVGGTLFRFIDTAGIRQTDEAIEKMGIARTFDKIAKADIVLGVLDLTAPEETLQKQLTDLASRVNPQTQQLIVVGNKADLAASCENIRDIDRLLSGTGPQKPAFLALSALTGQGIDRLKSLLENTQRDRIDAAATILVTNQRHYEALTAASRDLAAVSAALDTAVPTEFIAQDLRSALSHLGSITGEISADEVLGEIFGRFCIGK